VRGLPGVNTNMRPLINGSWVQLARGARRLKSWDAGKPSNIIPFLFADSCLAKNLTQQRLVDFSRTVRIGHPDL
jgi:hypothetical protein